MRKSHSVRRNRFTHILTWALVTVLAVQSFLPSCAYALETGRIQRLAEAIATYRSGSAVAIDAGVTVRTSDKMSEGVASGELSTSAETPEEGSATSEAPEEGSATSEVPEEGSATSEPATEGEPATSTAPNDGAGADGDAGGLDDPAQDESTAAEDAAAIEGAEVLSDGGDGSGKVLLADERSIGELDGRDYVGQTVKEINGTEYILIGTEQQLRAIGSGAQVHGPVYSYTPGGLVTEDRDFELYYSGDADLEEGKALHEDEVKERGGAGGALEGGTDYRGKRFCGVNAEGAYDASVDANTGLTYSSNANYIIFRDIDVSSEAWTPLMFSGTLLGASGAGMEKGQLWSQISDASAVAETAVRPVISGVNVNQSGKLDSRDHVGIGFFGTITNGVNEEPGLLGVSPGTTVVSNLKLSGVTVTNNSTETEDTQTLISGLGDLLGGILGDLIGGILGSLLGGLEDLLGIPLGGDLFNDLGDALKQLLDARREDPSSFATGAFAGRIVGDVEVSRCVVEDARVQNAPSIPDGSYYQGMTGGFVGYMEGVTEYDGLSDILGFTLRGLQALLNVIPGLGLGDLISLVENLVDPSKLIPTGYYNPVVSDCSVALASGSIGSADTDYAGGFAGVQIGAIVSGSTVSGAELKVAADEYAGGFTGLMRDAEMGGLLNNLGVKLIDVGSPQSLAADCTVSAGTLAVEAANHAGGFAGAMAASYVVDSNVAVKSALDVRATQRFAGGLVGEATLGWVTNLGYDEHDENLLSLLSSALTAALGSDSPGQLLSLMGFNPASIQGCSVAGASVEVAAEDAYAGGLIGHGEGTLIAAATQDNLAELSFWQEGGRYHGTAYPQPAEAANRISGLSLVTAGADYAGGIAGALETAAVGGLLNGLVGIGTLDSLGNGGFTAFELSDVTVNAADAGTEASTYAVVAGGYSAGGAVGSAAGGAIEGVSISQLASVVGAGQVGGFVGEAAAGSVVGTKGVDLLGLLKVSGLLSVAQCTQLTVRDCTVVGRAPADGAGPVAGETPDIQCDPRKQAADSAEGKILANEAPYLVVLATGRPVSGGDATLTATAGGFFGRASSLTVEDCAVSALGSVHAPDEGGNAGGFVGLSTTGGLASAIADSDEGADTEGLLDQLLGEGLIGIDNLLGAVPYMIPTYRSAHVDYLDGGWVASDVAGGFAGSFESGTFNVFDDGGAPSEDELQGLYAVQNVASVRGRTYAGGFAGKAIAGSLADAGGGLSLLGGSASLDLTKLLSVIEAYVPTIRYADVLSEDGFTVETAAIDSQEQTTSGAAGGFIGYGAAVQVSYSDVNRLAHTAVAAPDDLEASEASSYFDRKQSAYAVTAPQYAGGYFGYLNIGSTAGVASGLELLKNSPVADGLTRGISVSDLTSALDVMASTVEHSNVYGHAGGFSVLASGTDSFGAVGHAGGFAGKVSGGQMQDCNVDNFAYIIGQIAAGGYAGEIEPGSVADVLGEATTGEGGILDGLLEADNLASLAQAFVPTIRNSQTTCVPCGGAVRAQALSTKDGTDGGGSPIAVQRGMAGGYVGHNLGGQIWGNNNAAWKSENGEDGAYNGPQREAAAIRIRSVYGAEYAGGFTGLMEPGSTAETGGLSLLWGLINTNNLLKVMQGIYPTEENTAVYGPLRGLDKDTWNAWVDAVGVDNVYGELLGEEDKAAANSLVGHVDSDDEIAAWLAKIGYGTNVVAGSSDYDQGALTAPAGCAGGYVGSMVAGTITNGQAHDTKLVRAMRAAGGFVGAAETGGVAELGDADILGISLKLGELLPSLVSVFVPVIKCSSVTGYRQGMTVESFGSAPADGEGQHETDTKNGTGFAGGYIGFGSGAQIWGDADTARNGNARPVSNAGCTVSGLRRVSATAYAGGFAGKLCAASVASADTKASDGFLQGLLDTVISGTSIADLAEVLKASMSTVRNAHVSATATDEEGVVTAGDASWGFTVDAYTTGAGEDAQKVYPIAAGGFAGSIEATVLGELTTNGDNPDAAGGDNLNLDVNTAKVVSVSGLRGVDGGNFAGGLVGLADVAGAADVASGDTEGAGASVLKLIGLGGVSVLQAFQPCIYGATVDGVADGLTVRAHEADTGGLLTAERRSGNAGGFIGSIMSGAVRECALTNLSTVSGPSYTGGFIGYTGKSGVLDVEGASLLERLIGLDASAVNTFSTLVQKSTVAGIPAGYTVASTGSDVSEGEDAWQISGGFVGYADLAHITGCEATALKRVGSGEIAGGFAGEGTHAYLVSAEADSPLVKAILLVVSELVRVLWLEDLQGTGLIDIKLTDWILHLQVEGDGSTLKASLLGIPIEVTLNDRDPADAVAVAHVQIGSSTIDLNVSKDENGNVTIAEGDAAAIAVNLIKANMAVIEDSSVTGIAAGYDVFAGGATQASDAIDADSGFAGGFMGHSDEAQLKNNEMRYADVVKGAAGLVAPFAGRTDYDAAHKLDTVDKQITGNTYHVYRDAELAGETLSGTVTDHLEDPSASIVGQLDNGDPATDDTPASAEDAAWARFDIKGHKPVAGKSNHGDWKDAKAGDTPIDVWRDNGATAVLMANAAVSDNTGSLTPEPEEGQDPCAATADLTITKVWDDNGDALHRPESIEVELWQSYTDANGKVVRKPYDGMLPNNGGSDGSGITSPNITLSAAEVSPWSNTWQHVVKMLPVAWNDGDTVRYFSYSVEEVKLNGNAADLADYSTTVTPGEDGSFHIVITNRLPLPSTGGAGNIMLLLAGLATLAMGGVWFESRRRRQHAAALAEAARPAGRHFAPRER